MPLAGAGASAPELWCLPFEQKRKPHAKLTGVDPDVPAVSLIAQLNARSPNLTLDPSTCSLRTTFKERTGDFKHVLEVEPATFRSLVARGRVAVGWTSAALVEDIHVPTCTFCATYGHPRRACPVRLQADWAVCTRCAGDHLAAQCTVRMGDAAVCWNECRKAGHHGSHPTELLACEHGPIMDTTAYIRTGVTRGGLGAFGAKGRGWRSRGPRALGIAAHVP
ncbi:hypothetical protein HPB49_008530 [Dermacentor silvarum]|uniref:Uncharacterized protein n=1 Tax=Dermacentor silvarum TaxID=543639 RepID=A0ACB8DB89_DERSI|nr:hypothetical protein HPB49_008530 [Dermacentor silvarum]